MIGVESANDREKKVTPGAKLVPIFCSLRFQCIDPLANPTETKFS